MWNSTVRVPDHCLLSTSASGVAATTFYYSAFKDWNSLPSESKTTSNYNSFKDAAKAYLRIQLQLSEADNFIYY